jgi:hypothetical protein
MADVAGRGQGGGRFLPMADRKADVTCWSWAEVCARRLDRHALSSPAEDARPADVASFLGAVHAQVLSAAELSVGIRIAGATRADVRDALWTEHSLIKTFGPRGTVHLLSARDLPMWTGALGAAPPPPWAEAQPEHARMTPEQVEEVIAAIAVALAEADLTVDELSEAVIAAAGSWAGDLVMEAWQGHWPRWRKALPLAGMRGALCFGPNRGRKVTYTNPRRWLPGFRPAVGPGALADVVRRYLHAYGPATSQHFAQRMAAPRRWAAELFDRISGELEQVEVDGNLAWVAAGRHAAVHGPDRRTAVALLRRVRGRLPSARDAVRRPGRRTRSEWWPGRALPGAAHRRDGRRRLAPAPLRPGAPHHGGATQPTHRAPTKGAR